MNGPVNIKTDEVAHVCYFTWSSSTVPSSMVNVADFRAGSDWYQFNTMSIVAEISGVEMLVFDFHRIILHAISVIISIHAYLKEVIRGIVLLKYNSIFQLDRSHHPPGLLWQ